MTYTQAYIAPFKVISELYKRSLQEPFGLLGDGVLVDLESRRVPTALGAVGHLGEEAVRLQLDLDQSETIKKENDIKKVNREQGCEGK